MTKIKYLIISLVAIVGMTAVVPTPVTLATPATQFAKSWRACDSNFLGLPPWFRYLDMSNQCSPQIKRLSDVWLIALNVLDALIRLSGIVAVAFILWGGVKYIKSQGEPSALAEAKSVLMNAVIGLVIVFLAVAIVQYVARSLG